MKILKIGTTVFVVNKASKKHSELGVMILPAKIVGYRFLNKKLSPMLMRGKMEISTDHNEIFHDLEEAINSLKK